MSFSRFIRDRMPAIVIFSAVWGLTMIFLAAMNSEAQAFIMVSVLMLTGGSTILLWDFFRRNSFYKRTISALSTLDQKYLVSEILPEPDFADGAAMCEIISEACRSMYENVAAHRRNSNEFREFIELWVHEIKLPVAGLMLMCHNDGEKSSEYLPQIKRIDDCIENVLFYTRSENAEKDYIIKEVSLKKCFGAAALKNMDILRKNDFSITTAGLDTAVMTDSKWLEYILGQLISNSIKYRQPERSPEISVSAEVLPDRTLLHFRDNGCGIPSTDLPYIFEKSFTGENGRKGVRSTGMGLYIVHSLCQRLGHSISAESVQGEFTEITISFGKNDYLSFE